MMSLIAVGLLRCTPRVTCYARSQFRTAGFILRNNSYTCKKLVFEEFGDPAKVVKLKEDVLPAINSNEVVVKFLVAPINPADINCIQGVYPIKPTLPGVPGFEGVGEILETGENVNDLFVGDRVIPNVEMIGSWRTCGVFESSALLKVPKDVSIVEIAGISSNPSTAYRMLADFVKLGAGDVVIQNAANSACGQNVIQLCRSRNVISVNVIRDRADVEQLKSYLISLGANYVLTEEELRTTDIFKSKKCPKPKLALNAVSGRSATEISRHLDNGGVMVTYGGMSKEPVVIPVSSFIFKDLCCKGYWMTRWTREHRNSLERQQMLDDLIELVRSGQLKAPVHKLVPISQYAEALGSAAGGKGYTGLKYMFDFRME